MEWNTCLRIHLRTQFANIRTWRSLLLIFATIQTRVLFFRRHKALVNVGLFSMLMAHGIAFEKSFKRRNIHSLLGVDSIHWLQIVQLVAAGLYFSFPVPFFLHCRSGDCNLKGNRWNARNDESQLLGRHLASMLFAQLDSRAWLHSSLHRRSSLFLPLNSLLLELLEIPPTQTGRARLFVHLKGSVLNAQLSLKTVCLHTCDVFIIMLLHNGRFSKIN
jgi:hypothetical protein